LIRSAAHHSIKLCLIATLFVGLLVVPRASGEEHDDQQSCWIMRTVAASFIRRCGNKLFSFGLSIDEIRRMPGGDGRGRFGFACPIDLMCSDEPDIIGWFIDPAIWLQSERDESALLDILNSASGGLQRGPLPPRPQPSCAVFDATVADLQGKAVCYDFPEARSSWVVVVIADDTVGFTLIFQQPKVDTVGLRDKVKQILSRATVERAAGDVGLMRWMR
jgi:hypothetical protein